MSYKDFCKRVSALVHKAGSEAIFKNEDGRYIACCHTVGKGCVIILGNSVSRSVLVKWGSGHAAIAHI